MLLLLALGILIYTNVRLAIKKGKSPVAWGFASFLAFFAAFFLCCIFYLVLVYKGPQTPDALRAHLNGQPLTAIMLMMLGIGGVLIVRYILERSEGGKAS